MTVVGMVEEDLVAAALAAVVVVLVGSEEVAEISTGLAAGVLAVVARNEIGRNKKFYALCHRQQDTQQKRFVGSLINLTEKGGLWYAGRYGHFSAYFVGPSKCGIE